jgi:hypothetical protein
MALSRSTRFCRCTSHGLKRASTSPSGDWDDDDFDQLADGAVVGRILKVHAAPAGLPWMWTLAFGHHEDRTPTHGYEPTREAAMAAFAKELAAGVKGVDMPSWRLDSERFRSIPRT